MNISCRVISFKQTADTPEHIYFLSERPLEMGAFYYNRDMGRFAAIQKVLTGEQLKTSCPRVEATTEGKYGLPKVPTAFAGNYFKTGKTIKETNLRL